MQFNVLSSAANQNQRMAWYWKPLREVALSWSFIAGDVSSTIIPATLFLTAAWHSQDGSPGSWFQAAARGLIYFWLYIYTFCLSNQIAGLEEDRINKPHRPIVRGVVSLKGARRRWLWSMLAFTMVGWLFGVWPWTLLWQFVTILHNFAGCAKHWFGKNIIMAFGIVSELGAAWEIVRPMTPLAWLWVLTIAVAIFVLVPTQDLRDMEGDRQTGRRTIPLAIGERSARIVLAVCFAFMPLIIHFWLIMPLGLTTGALVCDALLAGMSLLISWRLLFLRWPRADHHTYLLFTYWYCMLLFSAIVVM
jgi:4-hydroxybenzoate polyprenyltransferase